MTPLLLAACAPDELPANLASAGWPTEVTVRVCRDGGDHDDIQAAIDASRPGDVIGVCPGTYGPIRIGWGQDVDVIGVEGPEATAIVGEGEPAVELDEGVLDLRGFRLRGDGVDDPWFPKAGALSLYEGTATLRDSIVEESTGPFTLLFDEDWLVVDNVLFRDNTSRWLWYLWQGEDDAPEPGTAYITRTIVLGGTHESILETTKLTGLTLRHNLFANVTIDRGRSAFTFRRDRGGFLDVSNNVFYGIRDLAPEGGRTFEDGDVSFRDNIVYGCEGSDLLPMEASWSLFWDNDVDYAPMVTGEGNLYADPMFVDPIGLDFRLQPGSPAIDAGDPDPGMNDPDGTRNDIGVFGGPEVVIPPPPAVPPEA